MKPDYWGYGTERLPGCSAPKAQGYLQIKIGVQKIQEKHVK